MYPERLRFRSVPNFLNQVPVSGNGIFPAGRKRNARSGDKMTFRGKRVRRVCSSVPPCRAQPMDTGGGQDETIKDGITCLILQNKKQCLSLHHNQKTTQDNDVSVKYMQKYVNEFCYRLDHGDKQKRSPRMATCQICGSKDGVMVNKNAGAMSRTSFAELLNIVIVVESVRTLWNMTFKSLLTKLLRMTV